MRVQIGLRWKIIAIYATVLIAGVLLSVNIIQQRYQSIFIEQKIAELSQQQAVILENLPIYVAQPTFPAVNGVESLILTDQRLVVAQSGFPEERLFNELTQIAASQQQPTLQYHYEIGAELMNVQITKVSGPQPITVISYVLTGVPSFLSNVLLQEVMVLFAFLFVIGSAIFLFWGLYLARDLQKINDFTQRIGERDWQARLTFRRNDELGAVAQKLQAVQQQLANNEAQQQRFFHQTSHDLKTPIAVIQGYAEAIQDDIYPQGTLDASVAVIIHEAKALNHKVEQLLSYAKMQKAPKTPQEVTDVVAIMQQQQQKLQPLYPQVAIVVLASETVIWPGTQAEWEQVIENLLANASRYAQKEITLTATKTEITIANDGPKFAPDELSTIFEAFVSGKDGKSGLGLAICQEFAHRYELQLQAENQEAGVMFRFKKKLKNEENL